MGTDGIIVSEQVHNKTVTLSFYEGKYYVDVKSPDFKQTYSFSSLILAVMAYNDEVFENA